jgi:hypothetical protein
MITIILLPGGDANPISAMIGAAPMKRGPDEERPS